MHSLSARPYATQPMPAVPAFGGLLVLISILRLVVLIGWRDGGRRTR